MKHRFALKSRFRFALTAAAAALAFASTKQFGEKPVARITFRRI